MVKNSIRPAIDSGIDFLVRAAFAAAETEVWWEDFDLYLGGSDEWVTAYAGSMLAATFDNRARCYAERACAWLERRANGRPPGFGFNGRATPDADSTAWACRLAESLGRRSPVLTSALGFLECCRQPDGGVATYPSPAAVRAAIHIPPHVSVDGWASSQVCVTAAAAGMAAFRDDRTRTFLREAQMPTGEWRGYWWCDAEYTTALAIECLAGSTDRLDRRAVELGAGYLRTCDSGDSAFSLALRIIGLCEAGVEPPTDLAGQLVELQQTDGSWPSSARLRIPAPGEMDPDLRWDWDKSHKGFGSVRLDINRIFTTATGIRALSVVAAK